MTTSHPAVSVVVSTRDRAERLTSLLDALRAQTLALDSFEVVAVDNGSRDATPDVLSAAVRQSGVTVRVMRRPRGEGPAAARNDGWRAARGALVAFTDDDCEPAPDWLAQGLAVWSEDERVMVQGRTEPLPRELHRTGPFSRTQVVRTAGPFYQMCNMFYPRALLERLGGFDTRTYRGVGGEDTDLAWRAIEHGVTVRFADGALVHHAVEDLGPAGHLRVALRWSDAMAIFRHPGFRRAVVRRGFFWKESHARLLAALLGLLAARRFPPAALAAAPYARHLAGRAREAELGNPALGAYFVVHDAVEMYAALRGAIRHRVLVL